MEPARTTTTYVGLTPDKRRVDWPAAVVDDFRPWTDAEEDASFLADDDMQRRRADR